MLGLTDSLLDHGNDRLAWHESSKSLTLRLDALVAGIV